MFAQEPSRRKERKGRPTEQNKSNRGGHGDHGERGRKRLGATNYTNYTNKKEIIGDRRRNSNLSANFSDLRRLIPPLGKGARGSLRGAPLIHPKLIFACVLHAFVVKVSFLAAWGRPKRNTSHNVVQLMGFHLQSASFAGICMLRDPESRPYLHSGGQTTQFVSSLFRFTGWKHCRRKNLHFLACV